MSLSSLPVTSEPHWVGTTQPPHQRQVDEPGLSLSGYITAPVVVTDSMAVFTCAVFNDTSLEAI